MVKLASCLQASSHVELHEASILSGSPAAKIQHILAGLYAGFKPESLPAVPGLEGEPVLPSRHQSILPRRARRCTSTSCHGARCAAGVGRVEANGEGASQFRTGQRVVSFDWGALHGEGTWQQYRVVPEATLIAVPESVSDTSAAQAIINPVAAVAFVEVTLSRNNFKPQVKRQTACHAPCRVV